MIKVTRFKCDFCSKTNTQKKAIAKHEEICFANPKNKACKTCKFLVKGKDANFTCMKNAFDEKEANPENFFGGLRSNCEKHEAKD